MIKPFTNNLFADVQLATYGCDNREREEILRAIKTQLKRGIDDDDFFFGFDEWTNVVYLNDYK